jgi:maltose/maltodextrin transport system substrate-binding protein
MKTCVRVTVAHPDQVEVKFQQTAATGNGPDIFLLGA